MAKNFKSFGMSRGTVRRPKQIVTRAQRAHKTGLPEKRPINAAGNPSSKLFDLRKEVLDRERAVGRKIFRHGQKGVNLQGTDYNPIRPNADISRYTDKQLRSYLYELNNFMKRSTQFEGDSFGNPIPRHKILEWKREARKFNKRMDDALDKVKNVRVFPDQGSETYGDRYERLHRRSRLADGHGRWSRINVDSVMFFSEASLDQAMSELKSRNKVGKLSGANHDLRDHFRKLTDYTGRKDIAKLADQLDDDVFEFMFKFSPLINESISVYALWKQIRSKDQNAMELTQIDDHLSDIKGLLEYEVKSKNIRRRL